MLCLSDHQKKAFKDQSTILKVTFTEIGVYISFTNISEGTAFLLQGLTYNDKVKLRRCNLK